jgi:hypothetical protein
MSKEVRMKVLVVTIVALAVLVGASCAGQSPVHRYHGFDFVTPNGPLEPGDVVLVDIYEQVEGADWVKKADDVPWPDVTLDFFWPAPGDSALPLPLDRTPARLRGDVQAVIGGEVYEVSCVTTWKAYKRLAVGFDKALDDCKPDLDPVLRLAVGIRGALDEVRSDTEAGWIHRTLGRVLAYKGVMEEA